VKSLFKRSIIAALALLLIALGFITYKLFVDKCDGFDIEIKNNTSESIRGLTITYENIVKDIELPEIEAGKIYKININPTEDFNENSMLLYYKDKRGVIQKNTLIGYFEKGYNGKVKVNINSQDKNGLIIMQIQEY
jgi:ABC-type lipoprotein release transport system permease subunit